MRNDTKFYLCHHVWLELGSTALKWKPICPVYLRKSQCVCNGRVGEKVVLTRVSEWRATSLSLPTFQHGGQRPRHFGYLQAHFKRLSFAALQSHRLLPVLLTGCHLISEIIDGRGALSSSAPPTPLKSGRGSIATTPPHVVICSAPAEAPALRSCLILLRTRGFAQLARMEKRRTRR